MKCSVQLINSQWILDDSEIISYDIDIGGWLFVQTKTHQRIHIPKQNVLQFIIKGE